MNIHKLGRIYEYSKARAILDKLGYTKAMDDKMAHRGQMVCTFPVCHLSCKFGV